jgi:hypothetical protein
LNGAAGLPGCPFADLAFLVQQGRQAFYGRPIAKCDHLCQEGVRLISYKMALLHAQNQDAKGACPGYAVLSSDTPGIQVISGKETFAVNGDGQFTPCVRGKQPAGCASPVFLQD